MIIGDFKIVNQLFIKLIMEQTFEIINVVTFCELTGLTNIDLFVLIKKYGRDTVKTANDWHEILQNDFVIPNDLRTPIEEPTEVSKSKKLLEKLTEKNKE